MANTPDDITDIKGREAYKKASATKSTARKSPAKGKPAPKGKGASKPKSKGTRKKRKRRSPAMRLLRALMLILSILAAISLPVTGYAGMLSPLKHGGFYGILPLLFPICMLSAAILLVLQLLWHWRGVLIIAAGFAVTAVPAWQVCPLNIHFGQPKTSENQGTFSLLTYNVFNFDELRDSTDTKPNRALAYILKRDADVVCLQEASTLHVNKRLFITTEQMAELHNAYPYIITANTQVILSKFPVQPIHIAVTKEDFDDADLAAYRLTLPGGKLLTLFNVHLQSFCLTADDRHLYTGLTHLKPANVDEVREQLIDKLKYANVERARQTQALLRFVRHYGGPDVVICGDFNDVPTCYALRTLEDAGFSSVYSKVGFGPMITYYRDRFKFCIDHVLYRGDMKPLSLKRATLRASDHYPVYVRIQYEK